MIECRSYQLHPGKLFPYLSLFERDGVLECLKKHMRGYWVAESGVVNSVWHLWDYADRATRAEVRAGMATDPVMANFLQDALPLIQQQSSHFLSGNIASPEGFTSSGVFDRFDLDIFFNAHSDSQSLLNALQTRLEDHAQVVAALHASHMESGHRPTRATFVLRFASFSDRDVCAAAIETVLGDAIDEGWIGSVNTQHMLPAKFSPWQ